MTPGHDESARPRVLVRYVACFATSAAVAWALARAGLTWWWSVPLGILVGVPAVVAWIAVMERGRHDSTRPR